MSIKLQKAVKVILAGSALFTSTGAFADLTSILAGNSANEPASWAGGSVSNTTRTNWAVGGTAATYSAAGSTVNTVVGVLGAQSTIYTGNGSNGASVGTLSSTDGWTGNPALYNDAWGHVGSNFYDFAVTAANQTVTITAQTLTGNDNIAFTVYATNGVFDGGTNGATSNSNGAGGAGISLLGSAPGHDFNQVGQIGAPGTAWMAAPLTVNGTAVVLAGTNPATGGAGNATQAEGNVLETLAYANSGLSSSGNTNGYGQTISYGVNQVATDNNFFSGSVSGSVSGCVDTTANNCGATSLSSASITFNNLAVGTYLINLGGANNLTTSGSQYQLGISSVPLPGAVYLFGSALAGLAVAGRKKQKLA